MYRIALRASLCVAIAVFPALAEAQPGNNQRPNIVLIITDDVGYGDFGSYGAPDIRTPHIDGLARDGVRLTDFYANGATCTPTRTGLIAGRYQQRCGLEEPLSSQGEVDQGRRGDQPAARARRTRSGDRSHALLARERRSPSTGCALGRVEAAARRGRAMLFNLRTDIAERNNLIRERADVVRRLRPRLAAWQDDVNAEAKSGRSR